MNRKSGRMSYENDDYSRFAGPGYHESHFTDRPMSMDRLSLGQNFSGKGPKGYQRGDARIHEDVCEALTDEPSVDASHINVTVEQGEVFLRGLVGDREARRQAEACLEGLRGITDIHNEIVIDPDRVATEGLIRNQMNH